MSTTYRSYKEIPFTPEFQQAYDVLSSGCPTSDALFVILDRLSEEPGHNASWSFASQDLTDYFSNVPSDDVLLEPICQAIATHWERIATRYLDPLSPALSAILFHAYKARVEALPFSPIMERAIRTFRTYPRFSNPYLNDSMIRALPTETMTSLVTTNDLLRFLPRDLTLDVSQALASREECLPILPRLLQTIHAECTQDALVRFIGSFDTPDRWTAMSAALATCSTGIHPFALSNPQALDQDILRGLRAIGTLKKNPLTHFPTCNFQRAPWTKLKSHVLLRALSILYRLETPTAMLLHGPDEHIIQAARLTLELNSHEHRDIISDFEAAKRQHDTMGSHGVDQRTWLRDRFKAVLGENPSSVDLLRFTKRIIAWADEDPSVREPLAAEIQDFLFIVHREWHYTIRESHLVLTRQLLAMKPSFLFPA